MTGRRLKRLALLAGAAFAVPAVINAVIARQNRRLVSGLEGEAGEYAWPLGRIAYQTRGRATDPALVLVHGIGAGSSSFEWRRNFDSLSQSFQVFAFDLPGFGQSERRHLAYTADVYVTALADFLRDIVQRPAAIVASSLSAAFAVKLAVLRPELVTQLALVCPTGLQSLQKPFPVAGPLAYGAFSLPAIGNALYNGVASADYIESYLRENLYFDPVRVTPSLVEHYYRYAHQPNAQFALRAFLSGHLNCDLTALYPRLTQPVLIAWGRQARVTPVEQARLFLDRHPQARLRVFENSGMLPHDEEAEDFNAAIAHFLAARPAALAPQTLLTA